MSDEMKRQRGRKTRRIMVGNNISGMRCVVVLVPQDEGLMEVKRYMAGLEMTRTRQDQAAKELEGLKAANLCRLEHGMVKPPELLDGYFDEVTR